MKKISLVLISLFVVLGFAGSALAATSGPGLLDNALSNNSGTFVGYLDSSNDNPDIVVNLIQSKLSQTIVLSEANRIKFEAKDLTIDIDTTDSWTDYSGSWTVTDKIYFYTVKAANGFELYRIEDPAGALSGTWSVDYLYNGKIDEGKGKDSGLSHISFWKLPLPPTTPVPIPASVVLLAPALFGVVGFSRRWKSYGRTNH